MDVGFIASLASLVVVAATFGYVIAAYFALIQSQARADSFWSAVDVQLKRRYDLASNLMKMGRSYTAHEKSALGTIENCRLEARWAQTMEERSAVEGQLTMALSSLFPLVEHDPQLRTWEEFTALEASLQEALRFYNAAVSNYNSKLQSFPTNLLAKVFALHVKQFFPASSCHLSDKIDARAA